MRKVFVDVTAMFRKDGSLVPLYFIWEDGVRYEIDKVIDSRKAASLKVGGQGIRYRCRVLGKEIHLYLEDGNRWFIEAR